MLKRSSDFLTLSGLHNNHDVIAYVLLIHLRYSLNSRGFDMIHIQDSGNLMYKIPSVSYMIPSVIHMIPVLIYMIPVLLYMLLSVIHMSPSVIYITPSVIYM
jgi:hypothetical protein